MLIFNGLLLTVSVKCNMLGIKLSLVKNCHIIKILSIYRISEMINSP